VDEKLTAFVENTKYMQRVLKKELMDLSASEKDLRSVCYPPITAILFDSIAILLS